MSPSAAPTIQGGYIGRFAPSPSGPLHMGSLVCAIASYLDAKSHNGQWLIRIEDIDPPREMPGADADIIHCLESHGLISDGPIMYQSTRSKAYNQALNTLHDQGLTYYCQCTRKRLKSIGGIYDGYCRDKRHKSGALKLNIEAAKMKGANLEQAFEDGICKALAQSVSELGDFAIHRKDGFYAYQLAVVIDDIAQHISHVVRGQDLLETTFQQQLLFELLGKRPPEYCHIPLVMADDGRKLSKQNGAPAIDSGKPEQNIKDALQMLKVRPEGNTCESLIANAINAWPAAKAALRAQAR